MPSPVNINIIQRVENVCVRCSVILAIKSYVRSIKHVRKFSQCLPVFKIEIVFTRERDKNREEKKKRYLFRIMKQRDGYTFMFFYVNTPSLRIEVDLDTFLGFLADCSWRENFLYFISKGGESEREKRSAWVQMCKASDMLEQALLFDIITDYS